jgi:tetratricopeptide (TPR) repeat protein
MQISIKSIIRCSYVRNAPIFALIFLAGIGSRAFAQQDSVPPLDLGVIVTSTEAEAASVLRQLKTGFDFGVLARERSIDPTANDGGYMGRLDRSQLRPEINDALAGLSTGEITHIVHVPAGFAVLKVLPAAPVTEDVNGNRVASFLRSGDIHILTTQLSGFSEADALVASYPKPDGWNRDLRNVCEVRNQSYAKGVQRLTEILDATKTGDSNTYSATEMFRERMTLADLYAYMGNMQESIGQLNIAYEMARASSPAAVPLLEITLGTAYLHLSEMENGVYRHPSDLDIFPPINPKASYQKKDNSKLAIQYLTQYLAKKPDDMDGKWLLNLAYMTLGQYPGGVPPAYLILESGFQSKEDIGRFVDVAPAAGLDVLRGAGGVIVDDFDNDGLLDVVASSLDVCDPLRFFHNNGDGTFTDRTVEAGLSGQLGALNIVQADYNNDGCMDILVLRGGWQYPQRKSLLRNNCDGTFTDVTNESGLGDTVTSTNSAVWADIDNDGYLDLFIGNENSPSQLFHNKGDGTFEDISHAAGIDQTAFTKGVTAADYDQDGYMDFYVSSTGSRNFLYHNNGNLTFTEVGRQAGVQAPFVSFATWFFDYDNDGWPDLFVTSYLATSVTEVLKTYLGLPHNAETLKLYRNKHDGTFEDVTEKVGLGKVFIPMGASFGDIDNDGFLDIYLGCGNPSYAAMVPHVLLHNKEGKSFIDITASSGTGELHKGHGISFADLERNGNVDIVANNGGAVPGDYHALRVYQNPGNKNDWINVRLVGVKTNRSGVGAQIKVTVTDDGQAPRTICRVVGQTGSFGADPMEQHIGLGHNARIVAVNVWWPATGARQHFSGVDKNQYIEIKEFANTFSKLERHAFRIGAPSATVASDAAVKPAAEGSSRQ